MRAGGFDNLDLLHAVYLAGSSVLFDDDNDNLDNNDLDNDNLDNLRTDDNLRLLVNDNNNNRSGRTKLYERLRLDLGSYGWLANESRWLPFWLSLFSSGKSG